MPDESSGRDREQFFGPDTQVELFRKAAQLGIERPAQHDERRIQPELRDVDDRELQNAVHQHRLDVQHPVDRAAILHHVLHNFFAAIGEIMFAREPGVFLRVERLQLAAQLVGRRSECPVQCLGLLNVISEDVGRLARERVSALEDQNRVSACGVAAEFPGWR